jgi:hypothetical protein
VSPHPASFSLSQLRWTHAGYAGCRLLRSRRAASGGPGLASPALGGLRPPNNPAGWLSVVSAPLPPSYFTRSRCLKARTADIPRMSKKSVRVRAATRRDLPLMRHLQQKLAHAIGYMPPAAIDSCLDAGWIQTADLNDDAAGFILARPRLACSPTLTPIIQAAVHFDALRRHVGLAMVDQLAVKAKAAGQEALTCWCAEELDANIFWEAAGFIKVGHRDPGNARDRLLNLWRLPLAFPFQTTLIGRPTRAGFFAKKAPPITLTPLAVALSQASNVDRLRLLPPSSLRYALSSGKALAA